MGCTCETFGGYIMRILILGINYAPEMIGTGPLSTGLAEGLARQGADVHVITAKPYYPAWRIFDGWRRPFWRRRTENGVKVVHCPLYVPRNPTGSRRILHHASFALAALPVALGKVLTFRPDVVIVVAPSMIASPVGWLAARLSGAKAWMHIQDFEVEAAFATGLLPESSWIGRRARAFEAWILRRFDRVSSISVPMVAKLCEKGVPDAHVYELRNWANLKAVRPVEGISPMKAELGITTRHVVLYSGNLANKQGLEIIPQMARHLAHRDDLTFVVCGDGPMRDTLVEMAEGLQNTRFLPLQPYERLSDLLGMADVHLLPQIAGAADLVLPSKLTNMLASGRPVLATADPNTALGKEVMGAGVIVPPEDSAAAAAALEQLLDSPETHTSYGHEARQRALERWDIVSIQTRFIETLRALIRPRDPKAPGV